MTSPSSSDGFPSIMSRCMEVVASADKLERISRFILHSLFKGISHGSSQSADFTNHGFK